MVCAEQQLGDRPRDRFLLEGARNHDEIGDDGHGQADEQGTADY